MTKKHEIITAYMQTSLPEQRRGVSEDALAEMGYESHQDTLNLITEIPIVDNPDLTRPSLTSQQQNRRAQRLEEEHLHRKRTPLLEPTHAELKAMGAQKRLEVAGHIRELRGVLKPGYTAAPDVSPTVSQPELPFDE